MDNEGQRLVAENRQGMAGSQERARPRGREILDIIIAASAVVISLVSLWVALRTDHTQEELLRSSVWPYVQYTKSAADAEGRRQLVFELRNLGVGPAIVRSFAVSYDGHFVATLDDLLRACCPRTQGHIVHSSTIAQSVIVSRDAIAFIQVPPELFDRTTYRQLDAARRHVEVLACYCSVLGDCWVLDSKTEGPPASVGHCPPPQQPQYST